MNFKFFYLVLTFALSASLNIVLGAEQVIAFISTDSSDKSYNLVLESDDRTIQSFYKDVYENNVRIRRDTLDLRVFANTGMILEQRDKYIVLKIKSHNFDPSMGGLIEVDTLYSGISGERKSYQIELALDKTGWSLFNKGRSVKKMNIQTNRIIAIGPIGIKNIVMK